MADNQEMSKEEISKLVNGITDQVLTKDELRRIADAYWTEFVDGLAHEDEKHLSFEDKKKKIFGESHAVLETYVKETFIVGFKSGVFNAYKYFEAQGFLELMDTPDDNIN